MVYIPPNRCISLTCLLCEEEESCNDLFFNCVVARLMWERTLEVLGLDIGQSFESVGARCLSKERFTAVNIIRSAALWGVWKLMNDLCFQNAA